MKKLNLYLIMATFVLLYGTGVFCKDNISFEPINHATFIIKSPGITVYNERFESIQNPCSKKRRHPGKAAELV